MRRKRQSICTRRVESVSIGRMAISGVFNSWTVEACALNPSILALQPPANRDLAHLAEENFAAILDLAATRFRYPGML